MQWYSWMQIPPFPNPRAWKFPNPTLKFPNPRAWKFPNPGGSEFPNPRAWKFPNPTLKFPNPRDGKFPNPRAWEFPNPPLKFPNPTLANPSYPFLPQKMQHPDRSRPSCRLAGLGQALGGISGGNFNPAVSVALGCVNSMKGPGMDWKQAGSVHSEPWNDIEHHDYDASSESCAYLQCDDLSIFTVSFIKLTVSFRPVFRLHAVHSASTRAVVKTWSGGHVLHLAGTIPG